MSDETENVTELLAAVRRGEPGAADAVFPLVYRELRRIAANHFKRERRNHTLQPTALVHEAYIRLVDDDERDWSNRAHFVGLAARVMRNILIDHARRRSAAKRAEGGVRVTLAEDTRIAEAPEVDLISLDRALDELESVDPRLVRLVDLRFFGGLTIPEAAELLGVSTTTVERDWATARAWLRSRVSGDV